MPTDPRDALILMLCERLFICSRLLTRAAERLAWDSAEVQELVRHILPSNGSGVTPDLFERREASDE